jgi:hypothetical protein
MARSCVKGIGASSEGGEVMKDSAPTVQYQSSGVFDRPHSWRRAQFHTKNCIPNKGVQGLCVEVQGL